MHNTENAKAVRSVPPAAVLYFLIVAIIATAVFMRMRREKRIPQVVIHNFPIRVLAYFGQDSLGSMPSTLATTMNGDACILTVTGGLRGQGSLDHYRSKSGKIRAVRALNHSYVSFSSVPSELVSCGSSVVYGTQSTSPHSASSELFSFDANRNRLTPLLKGHHLQTFSIVGHDNESIYLCSDHMDMSDINKPSDNAWAKPSQLLQYSLSKHKVSVLCSFPPRRNDYAAEECSSLVTGNNGMLYGARSDGGSVTGGYLGTGEIFKIAPNGIVTVAHAFSPLRFFLRNRDGANPVQLASDAVGDVYGITARGGEGGNGVLFKIAPNGTFTVLHSFSATTTGNNRSGVHPTCLIVSPAGIVYGAADLGGSNEFGTIFRYVPSSHTFDVIHEFGSTSKITGQQEGAQPLDLTFTKSGNLMGVTEFGGKYGGGTLFELKLNRQN